MDRLNYSHLLYFWLVAREGGVSKAAERVGLAQPTLSGQIRTLESVLGERLFERVGRRLQELMEAVKRRPTGRPLRLTIGLDDVITKTMAHRLILPLSEEPDPMRVVMREAARRNCLPHW